MVIASAQLHHQGECLDSVNQHWKVYGLRGITLEATQLLLPMTRFCPASHGQGNCTQDMHIARCLSEGSVGLVRFSDVKRSKSVCRGRKVALASLSLCDESESQPALGSQVSACGYNRSGKTVAFPTDARSYHKATLNLGRSLIRAQPDSSLVFSSWLGR